MSNHDVLTIGSGETYSITGGQTEEWRRAEIDGTLDLSNGNLRLIDDPDLADGEENVSDDIVFPLRIDVSDMEPGNSIFLIGVMSVLLGASAVLRNWLAGLGWALSFILLIMAGVFGLGLEVFWMGIIATIILLVAGMVVRGATA